MSEEKKAGFDFEKLKKALKGKVTVLYGNYGVGKTIFSLLFSKNFRNSTFVVIDKNYHSEYYKINPKAKFIDVNGVWQLRQAVKGLHKSEDTLVVVDSITTIQSELVGEKGFSPRAYLEYNNTCDWITNQLSKLKPEVTSVIIAHERIKDWESQQAIPRFNPIALRNVDIQLRMVMENGKRKLQFTFARTVKADNITTDYEVV